MNQQTYTIAEIKLLAEQLRDIKIKGEPAFDVDVQFSEYGLPHKITLKTWGTVAINEFPAALYDDKAEWVKVHFVVNPQMHPEIATLSLQRMLSREYPDGEFLTPNLVHIKPRNDYEWSVSDRDRWDSLIDRDIIASWEVVEPADIDIFMSRSFLREEPEVSEAQELRDFANDEEDPFLPDFPTLAESSEELRDFER